MRRLRFWFFLAVAACSSSSSDPGPGAAPTTTTTTSPPSRDAGGGGKDASGPHTASEALQKCAAAKGDIGSIADAVARYNALVPNGGDGACFVATLPRPLSVVATSNAISAQPAGGRGAPRIFFMLPKIVIAAVPDGEGSKVMEFGEWVGTTRTLKGEIGLPVTTPLAADAPFTRVLRTGGTTCATCHREEEKHPTIANGFVSSAFQPDRGTFVTLADLEELHRLCTSVDDNGPRCSMIHAVLDFGPVTDGAFSPAVATFQGN